MFYSYENKFIFICFLLSHFSEVLLHFMMFHEIIKIARIMQFKQKVTKDDKINNKFTLNILCQIVNSIYL